MSTGRTTHHLGTLQLPTPAMLRIVTLPPNEGLYLLHLDAAGEQLTDTYHETLEDALEQAEWEFGISAAEWRSIHGNN